MSGAESLLTVDNVTVSLTSGIPIIEDVNLTLKRGEILGLVGESGSGKSTLALSLLGFARGGARLNGGQVTIDGHALFGLSENALRSLRGNLVSYVPQDPASSLNPARRLGDQLADRIRDRPASSRAQLIQRALERAQLPTTPEFLRRYPHQISGGQQQRALIAMAIAGEPALLVLDEPTTGLDVVTQAGVLSEILALRDTLGVGIVYVSHDIAAVSVVADLIAVMYAGRIVEQGPTAKTLSEPVHPYTLGLMQSVPDHTRPTQLTGLPGVAVGVGEWPGGCAYAPRCPQATEECGAGVPGLELAAPEHRVRCIHWQQTPKFKRDSASLSREKRPQAEPVVSVSALKATHGQGREEVVAAEQVSFSISPGECLALVGESGSGKTTIARCIAGLHVPAGGEITLHGEPLSARASDRSLDARRRLQFVFQNPYESLNPRHRVADTISDAAQFLRGLSKQQADSEAAAALEQVRLPARVAMRYPGELSGGERQRVAIARGLAAQPDILICDEITSALDVSVQATIIDLLENLRAQLGLALLFITHDLGLVASAADRVLVLSKGHICESGVVTDVLTKPKDEYTQLLLSSAPELRITESGRPTVAS